MSCRCLMGRSKHHCPKDQRRIRELEAELASQRMVFESVRVHDEVMRTNYLQARARAEKAEAELARRLNDAMNWKARAEKAEDELKMATSRWAILESEYVARVAELEHALRSRRMI